MVVAYIISAIQVLGTGDFAVIEGKDVLSIWWLVLPVVFGIACGFFEGAGSTQRFLIAGHLIAAILVHPYPIKNRDSDGLPTMDHDEQREYLELVHAGGRHQSWQETNARILAKSLRYTIQSRYQLRHPILFWFDPRAILCFSWAMIFMFVAPLWGFGKKPPGNQEEVGQNLG